MANDRYTLTQKGLDEMSGLPTEDEQVLLVVNNMGPMGGTFFDIQAEFQSLLNAIAEDIAGTEDLEWIAELEEASALHQNILSHLYNRLQYAAYAGWLERTPPESEALLLSSAIGSTAESLENDSGDASPASDGDQSPRPGQYEQDEDE